MTESPTLTGDLHLFLRGACPDACAFTFAKTDGASIFSTSSSDSGTGELAWATKPVTDGVCRTAAHDPSVRSIRTST